MDLRARPMAPMACSTASTRMARSASGGAAWASSTPWPGVPTTRASIPPIHCSNIVFVYDYDAATGAISNERPFLAGFERGSPDGSAVDSQGYLWNCRHGGGCIVRVAPSGEIERVIEMPARNITSCTFGGADYRTVYVTSAGLGAPTRRTAGGLPLRHRDRRARPAGEPIPVAPAPPNACNRE